MSDFPTEEDLFEMEHADEFEMMNNQDSEDPLPKEFRSQPLKPTNGNTQHKEDELESNLNRKRGIEDILEAYPELDEEFIPTLSQGSRSQKKKSRVSEENMSRIEEDEFNLISQIHKQREERQSEHIMSKRPVSYSRWKMLRRIPEGGYMSITSSEGERGYTRMYPETQLVPDFSNVNLHSCTQLLQEPYHVVKQKALKELSRRVCTEVGPTVEEVDSGVESSDSGDDDMWVERFRPRTYIDLLSDDGTNRTFLQWLKLWDHIVFGKEKKAPKPQKEEKKEDKFKKVWTPLPELDKELDAHKRPKLKLALLCGPPGLGKTTLAHVIAKHAGYNVVEMNASDDRSPEAFITAVENSTQMKSVLGDDHRPNCLVIDEIDGAPAPSINVLINMVLGKHVGKGKGKKKGEGEIIKRPIICICNDEYVPALRPLKQHALILHFPPTLNHRLASRLLSIARAQSVVTDMSTLLCLTNKTDCDIRSCLSTLEFVSHSSRCLKMKDVQGANIAQKDLHKSLFTLWQEIFSMPRPNKGALRSHEMGADVTVDTSNLSATHRFYRLLALIQSGGDYDKLYAVLQENFLNMKFKDTNMEAVVHGCEWLCFYDVVQQEIQHSQNYTLMRFHPYTGVMFHFLFASLTLNKITYPSVGYQVRQKIVKSQHLVSTLIQEMSPTARAFNNTLSLITDLLPALLYIIQPNTLRAVNPSLYSAREKAELQRLIAIMTTFNLTYRQLKADDQTYTYVLDPDVECLVTFPDIERSSSMSYTIKQLIAKEIEQEKIRRNDPLPKPTVVKPAQNQYKQPEFPKPLTIKEKGPVDFFGRLVVRDPEAVAKKADTDGVICTDVWYHFKEGFNNAVRRNLKMSDFL